MHSSQAATAAARHGLSVAKAMSQSLSQGNEENTQQGLKRTASQAGLSQVQVGKRLQAQEAMKPLPCAEKMERNFRNNPVATRIAPDAEVPSQRMGASTPTSGPETARIPLRDAVASERMTLVMPANMEEQDVATDALHPAILFPFGDFSGSPLGLDDFLYPTEFDQLVRNLAQQQARGRLSDPLEAGTAGEQQSPLLANLQSWLETGPAHGASLAPVSQQERELRIHRARRPTPDEILFPNQPTSSVAQFIPVTGWQSTGLDPLPSAPTPTAVLAEGQRRTLTLFNKGAGAVRQRRKPLKELDANASKASATQPLPRKKRRIGSSSDTIKLVCPTGGCSATFASGGSDLAAHQDSHLAGWQEDQQWLHQAQDALLRATHLANEEAHLRRRLHRLGVVAEPFTPSLDPSLPMVSPSRNQNGTAGRSDRTLSKSRMPDMVGTLSRGEGLLSTVEFSDKAGDIDLASDEELPRAFWGTFTSTGLQIDKVAPPKEETLGQFLKKRVARSSRALAESVWRVHGKQLLTLGPSPPSQAKPRLRKVATKERKAGTARAHIGTEVKGAR